MRTVADVKAILSLNWTQNPQISVLTAHISTYMCSQWNKSKEKILKFVIGCIFDEHFRT